MMTRHVPIQVCAFCTALSFILLVVATTGAQTSVREPETFLEKYIHLSKAELAKMKRGEVVSKLVAPTNKRELAVFGVVRLDVPKDYFVKKVRDIVEYKKNESILQIGKFSDPPRLDDLAGLTVDASDIADLKKCRVGDCDLRFPAAEIERFQREIDWSRRDVGNQVTKLTREILLKYVTAYLSGGYQALAEYHDQKHALSLAEEFHSLIAASPYLAEYAPEFQTYLEKYPAGQLENVENLIYWSKESFGLKPVISLTHMTILTVKRQGATHVIISSKQLYASHYFDSSLALTVFVEELGGGNQPLSYLIYLNRSRTNQLRGLFSGLRRSIVEGKMLTGVRQNLLSTKEKLETRYRQSADSGAHRSQK
ncbi:MAG: hypothetical protein HY774_20320 [Acidobacteria bacterium]|nr:hypothetical protein [Acidobacteriota bacterium]